MVKRGLSKKRKTFKENNDKELTREGSNKYMLVCAERLEGPKWVYGLGGFKKALRGFYCFRNTLTPFRAGDSVRILGVSPAVALTFGLELRLSACNSGFGPESESFH